LTHQTEEWFQRRTKQVSEAHLLSSNPPNPSLPLLIFPILGSISVQRLCALGCSLPVKKTY
jgi:hypothetical protein